jgi:hypothetical protein
MKWTDDCESLTMHREEYNDLIGRQRSLKDALDRRAGLERRLAAALGVDPDAPSDTQVKVALATVRRLRRVERAAKAIYIHLSDWLDTGKIAGPDESRKLYEALDRAMKGGDQ